MATTPPEQVARSQAITRWLAQEHHFPATQPLDDTSPVTVDTAVVSFWTYYPQPENAPPLTSAHLAILLRLLHQSETPPVALPTWVPLASLHATVTDPALSAVLTDDERAWIMGRITEVRDKIASLDWPLGTGLIHGDAWAGNLLSSPGAAPVGAVLGDWDWVSTGPREIDLIPTWHAAARYGKPTSWVSDFTARYGYDLARWEGYPVLMAMRDLVQLTGRSAAPATPTPTSKCCASGSTACDAETPRPSGQHFELAFRSSTSLGEPGGEASCGRHPMT